MRRIALIAIPLLLLAGCAAATEPPTPTKTADAPPADGGTFGSIDNLVDAFVAAGGDCAGWNQTNVITLAAESGDCDDNTVLSTYASQADKDEVIANHKALMEMIGGGTLLVGGNWILNDKNAGDYQEKLGGTIVDTTG